MNTFWLFIMVIATVFLVFVVIPNGTQTPSVLQSRRLAPQLPVSHEEIEDTQSKEMLNAHYVPARKLIPIDAPFKKVGECPYSKPPSTDLPVRDIPMNVAMLSKNMRLS